VYARRGDGEKGIQLMQRGVNIMEKAEDFGTARKLLMMLAAMQHELGILDDAIASYSAATLLARKANDIKGEARIYRCVGSVLRDKKDDRSALHSFKVAVQLSDQSGDKLGLISSSLLAGNCIVALTPLSAEALPYWKQALRVCKELGVEDVKKLLPLRSEAYFRLINHYETQKLYSVALPYRVELMEMMRAAGLVRGYATALLDVADVQARLGLVQQASVSFKEAITLWAEFKDAVNEAIARTGYAGTLLTQGNMHDARLEADAARRLLEKTTADKESAAARVRVLATASELLSRTGEVELGSSLAQKAIQIAEGVVGGDVDAVCMAKLALARALFEEDSLKESRKVAAKALNAAITSQLYPQIHQGLEILGDISLKEGNQDKGAEYFEKMAKLAGKSGVSWAAGPVLQRLAEIEEKRGNLQAAVKLHMDAVQLLGDQQAFRTHKSMAACARLYIQMGNPTASEAVTNMIKHLAADSSNATKKD
jgi:tetratricopeptide (TPR) repeat protein